MKKFMKTTAMILAVSITMTAFSGCAAANKRAFSAYEKAEITQVAEKSFTLYGQKGEYSGDWKGNRPEGQGKLFIGENDYYSGEWYNGMPHGQFVMQKTDENGMVKHFEGECVYGAPGNGKMLITSEDNEYNIEIDGDFNDETSLVYYMTDQNGQLMDIGNIVNGDYVSVVGQENFNGIAIEDLCSNDFESHGFIVSHGYEGTYIGQTDENGVPNGYGYCFSRKPGDYEGIEHLQRYFYKLGTWKDGSLCGNYTIWYYEGLSGNWTSKTAYCGEDGFDVGERIIHYYDPDWGQTKIVRQNCDTIYDYQLCSDGRYRTDYEYIDYYYDDGRHEFQRIRTVRDDLDGYIYYYEGEYTIVDANGNVLSSGTADSSDKCNLRWVSYGDALKEQIWETLSPVIAAGVIVGVFAIGMHNWSSDFEDTGAGKWLAGVQERTRADMEHFNSEKETYDDLMDKARSSTDPYEADRLRREAEDHCLSIWW